MKRSKFLLLLSFALVIATGIGSAFGVGAGAVAFGTTLFNQSPKGSVLSGIIPETWTNYIIETLFKDNEFMLESIDESQYVLVGSVVHIPQAGTPSGVKRNRENLPATITRRKDIDITYSLDELTTDPRMIPNADVAQLSYNKLDSCMSEDMSALKQVAAEAMLYNWRPTYFLKTTGATIAAPLGTGNRKSICVADFVAAKKLLNKWNVPKADRHCLLDTEMIAQLATELSVTSTRQTSVLYDQVTGEIKKLEGFTIHERSTALIVSNQTLSAESSYFKWTSTDLTYTPEQLAAIDAGTANIATTAASVGLFWHKTMVARAMGTTDMFYREKDPTYYADIYSFLQRLGGRTRRADGKGVLGVLGVTV